MKKALQVVILLILFACNGGEKKPYVEKQGKPLEGFESFVFSIEPGLSNEASRDVEILKDGTTYLRLRADREIKENYTAVLDPQDLRQVFLLIDALDVKALDTVYQDYSDGAFYSLLLKHNKGETRIKGMDLPDEVQKMLMRVVKIVEGQQLSKSPNRHFSTAKDVLIPPPPGIVELQELLDSLYHL